EGARATGESDERVGERGHLSLAFVHGVDHMQVGELVMGEFAVDQVPGHDADDLTPGVEDCVSEHAHEPHPAPAVDDGESLLGEVAPEVAYGIDCLWIGAERGTGEGGDTAQSWGAARLG